MTEYANAVPGTFCWVELATTDPASARKFYSSVFGWSLSEMPMPGGDSYGVAQIAPGKNVGGITRLPEEAKQMGATPNWLSYVAVENAAAAAKQVASLGGRVVKGPLETPPGNMVIVADPTGGVFALWQEHQSMGTFVYQEQNASCWNELMTSDVDRAGTFYGALFGWKAEATQMPHMTYTTFKKGDRTTAGMMPQPAEMTGGRSGWTVYFAVSDADATAKKIASLGGRELVALRDFPNVGRLGYFADREGAPFAILNAIPPAK